MIQAEGIVLGNEEVAPSYFKLAITTRLEYKNALPGQFVMVRIPGNGDTILRRPFSIHQLIFENGTFRGIEILYKVVGKGTSILAKIREGEEVDVLGPLGKGFFLPQRINRCFLVAGGIGIAPLVFLLGEMKTKGWDMKNITLFFGAAGKKDLLCLEALKKTGIHVHLTTDDGSCGEKGLVTEPLKKAIRHEGPDIICACGPLMMLKQVAALAEQYKVPCQISLEALMACGMGACLGCAIKNRKHPEKYDHVCVDGPVFNLENFQF